MLEEYLHMLTDPAHTLVELTYIMFDLVILKVVIHFLKKHMHRDLRAGKHVRRDK